MTLRLLECSELVWLALMYACMHVQNVAKNARCFLYHTASPRRKPAASRSASPSGADVGNEKGKKEEEREDDKASRYFLFA